MQLNVSILFVDDEVRIVKLLNMMFRSLYQVHTATSGAEALEIIARESIDIIVSDQRMPGMLGIDLLSQVRRISPATMRILLTGYTDLVAIIGAVNEGEVYRFLNKPWNHDEIKSIMADCAKVALLSKQSRTEPETRTEPAMPLASAAKLLMLDGIASDRYEAMEMFTEDFNVLTAETIDEAEDIMQQHDVGVIVTDSQVGGTDTVDMLCRLKKRNPHLTIVLLSGVADCDTIIRLINQASIYRFAMKPISPNVFRLAVSSAMREHHRLLADLPTPLATDGSKTSGAMPSEIVSSLSRFTKVY